MTPPTLSRRQLNRATLARQMLLEREPLRAADAVQRLAGMQAQEPKHPFVGLWTRVAGFGEGRLRDALLGREVVRATLMRSTLHLMSAADYVALRMALQPSAAAVLRVLGARAEGLDLGAVLPAARALLAGNPLRFDRIRALLGDRFAGADERALGYAVRTLIALVMVPSADARWGYPRIADFALAEEWLDEPLAPADHRALARSYLAAFGPASGADAQAWSGLAAMKTVLDAMRDELEVFADERGRELFDLPDAPRPDPDVPAQPRYLPEFDNLVLAHDDRSRVVADEHRPLLATKNLRVRATFLVDGVVAGTWTTERRRSAAALRLQPFAPLPARPTEALVSEGEALLRFVEPGAASYDVIVGP